jgi:signal transduction histidine kinase
MGIVSELLKINLYRICKSLQNINKYANANIKIDLRRTMIKLVISDNGRGFDAKVKKEREVFVI